MIVIFYGPGKGKSSAAAGIALRAWGQGKRVLYLAFLKSRNISGEFKAMQTINSSELVLATFGRECPYPEQECCPGQRECLVLDNNITTDDVAAAQGGINYALQQVKSGQWDLVILDELLNGYVLYPDLQQSIIYLLEEAGNVDLVLTGRPGPEEILGRGELVTELRKISHPFDTGISARKGIDY